jgi:hypothetical protein
MESNGGALDQIRDGRTTVAYPPDTIIPNPARRRLDYALRIARVREGDARRELARLEPDDPRRQRPERELADAMRLQAELQALRPQVRKHARLDDTELAGKLVAHTQEYKHVLDTVRVAAANAESDLAALLAPHLYKPREAKRVLQNLFSAPGRVRVGPRAISITLLPAGNGDEKVAIDALLHTVNARKLTLPGDHHRRPLVFRSPIS